MYKGLLLLMSCAVAPAFSDHWIRLSSPRFEVWTNAGERQGRDVLQRFEQIRHVFETRSGHGSLMPLPVRVFVFRSASDFRRYQVSDNSAGYYQSAQDRDYIAMQTAGQETYRIVYHEYTHLLLRHAGYNLPVWFGEGIAELFSTAHVGKDAVRVGDPVAAHVRMLREQRMLDMSALTSITHDSPHYNERGKKGLFYAQSWALVHMLNFAPEYRPGLEDFIAMIRTNQDAVPAFQQVFRKSPETVLQDLKAYLQDARFESVQFPATKLETAKIPSQPVNDIETQLALADLLLATGKIADARTLYAGLEARYPNSSSVLAALGRSAFHAEEFTQARHYFETAIASGGAEAEVFYDYAMVLRQLNEPDSLVVHNLQRAVTVDEAFFDARQFLGYLFLSQARYAEAIVHLKRATELQPTRASVWENLALAYHRNGAGELALKAAHAASASAKGPEEAVRLDALIKLIEFESCDKKTGDR